ncbi:hypothetical protein BDF19DRAFT_417515 [Syncephalis fuscata]|nr:hypothetical protein BDF19DRAFT_417515 [Syncephalis fuscata]
MFEFFLIIIGLSPKRKWLQKTARTCPQCGACALMQTRVDQRLSLFFVPLFPVYRGHAVWVCHRCGYVDQPGAHPQRQRQIFPSVRKQEKPPAYLPDRDEKATLAAAEQAYRDPNIVAGENSMDHCGACSTAIGSSSWRFCPYCGWERPSVL